MTTAALLGQAEPVDEEEKQRYFQITGQSLVIFKQGKKRVYKAASGIQGLRGQKKSLHPGKKTMDDVLVGACKSLPVR